MPGAGNVGDVTAAPALLERAKPMRYLVAGHGYDADRLRRSLRAAGTTPVIPGRRNRKRPIRHDRRRYRGRHLIENAFCRLGDFRRVARAMTNSPPTSCPAWHSSPPSRSGSERV